MLSMFFVTTLTTFFAYADSSIVITVINLSPHALMFERTSAVPGARFTVDKRAIDSGSEAVVVGTITADIDLVGSLFFNDGRERLSVNVRRLKHFGQPRFTLHSDRMRSSVDRASLKFNTDGIPDHLSHVAVTLTLL